MKYRYNQPLIEAIQVEDSPERLSEISAFLDTTIRVNYRDRGRPRLLVETEHGQIQIEPGSYIIKDSLGRIRTRTQQGFESDYRKEDTR